MKAYTYILFSESAERHYTGSCDDLRKRFERHNEARVPSTKYGVPWKLIWHRECDSRSEARMLESKIKKRGAARFLEDQLKQE
ncbi:GIY-YIG nuclease family protein [Rhodohalobacter sp. 8-1]|uniref:GIY-YIG nuclease family protein n=1 Tax=Rhodohalobacter sp. 8-1 TaxID=3131972 RepID=UPI00403F72C3